jgi:zinc/manganese transport system substrate-binding protein
MTMPRQVRAPLMRPGLRDARATVTMMALLVLTAGAPGPALGQSEPADPVSIVVTTDVLGGITRDLVGDAAGVAVLMDGGVDPHAWAPSARDTEAVLGADLVIANGLDLEEGLLDVLAIARADGVRVFEATDHVSVRALDPDAADAELEGDTAHEVESEHREGDPHFWLDPLAMRDVVIALVPALEEVGVDVADSGVGLVGRLEALDAEVVTILSTILPERRRLVTGHESMGYFADRYGFELIGAVVPGLSSQGEVSARELSELVEAVRAAGVDVVLTEVGTPDQIAHALATETGATIVPISLEQLPDDGSYESLIREIATVIAETLAG